MNYSKEQILMNMIKMYSNFSKCQFTKVGAMAVDMSGRVIATGVNGTLPGSENCCDHHFDTREDHVQYTLENEIHAEENLILELATRSVKYSDIEIYVTHSPCHQCLKHLLGLTRSTENNTIRINRIIYDIRYHRLTDDDLLKMKQKAASYGTQLVSLSEADK